MNLPALLLLVLSPLTSSAGGTYTLPALTLPPTPPLPPTNRTGYVATAPGVNIWYAQFGAPLASYQAAGGVPVLFLHGGFANADYFGHQVAALLAAEPGRSILAIDSRMQGRSTGLNESLTYDLMRQDVVAVLDHFGIAKASVVGWSDGGIIGLGLAMVNPERVDRLFSFAASISPASSNATVGNSPVFQAYLKRVAREYKQMSPTPNGFDTLRRKLFHLFATEPHYSAADFASIPTLYQDCEGAPLIWVVDAADEETIKLGVPRAIHNRIQASGLLILPSVSHFAFLQDPETFNVAVERFVTYQYSCS